MMRAEKPRDTHLVPELRWDDGEGRHVGRLTVRVRYAETDRMGIVYNGNYLTWFEIGRTEFMRSQGTPYRTVEERGYQLPLVEASLKIRVAIGYDDVITIETWIEQIRSRTLTFRYRISKDETLVAEGVTTHACVSAADGRTAAFPDWLREKIVPAAGS